ncbi:hypothetical protein BHM03_00057958 [Ensete ventricosum]|nr:hypothetical protein BHM03_00057958 [Ensete ventricosum]
MAVDVEDVMARSLDLKGPPPEREIGGGGFLSGCMAMGDRRGAVHRKKRAAAVWQRRWQGTAKAIARDIDCGSG